VKDIDIPVGRTVKYRGKRGVCTEVKFLNMCCSHCILHNEMDACMRLCTAHNRKDGKDVYFKEIKEVINK